MSSPQPAIVPSSELVSAFAAAIEKDNVRFLKISLKNEILIPDGTTPRSGDLQTDLAKLAGLVEEDVPAFILVRLDTTESHWLAVSYVPNTAPVREKMQYAFFRGFLTKALGDQRFVDNLFATSKSDLTPEAYAAHRKHIEAPQPLSAREAEMEQIRAAEREAGGAGYEASRAKKSHIGTGVGLAWNQDVERAVKSLIEGKKSSVVVISIDPSTEKLVLTSSKDITVDKLADTLPPDEPSFSFFAWPQSGGERLIVFIYSCPSNSPIKYRMIYSSGVSSVIQTAKELSPSLKIVKKIETSNPAELTEDYLRAELPSDGSGAGTPVLEEPKKPFARPKGPGRKR